MGTAGMLRLGPPLLAALSLIVSACQSQPPAAPAISAGPTPTAAVAAPAAQPTAAPAAAPAKPAQGGTVTIGLDQEPPTLDPEASPSAVTFYITSSVGETLLYIDENRQIQPWLAQSWEVSEDAKTFTFHLRNDVTFQDGTPFNAA